jgi:DNA processing protein
MRALVGHFGSAAAVLAASTDELRRVAGIGPKIAGSIVAIQLQHIELQIPRWQAEGVRIITDSNPSYPPRLRSIHDAPPTLFVRGIWDTRLFQGPSAAIVGTRSPSPAAARAASLLSQELAGRGYTIVSGLALGIDKAAHLGALGAAGRTAAVLGGGILNIYPSEHRALATAIAKQGALVSETAPYAESKPPHLVARNRIITGLSQAVVIIETSAEGGAMYAARRAQEQGRTLYVLDLPASGNQMLIAQGAIPLPPERPEVGFAE